MPEESAAERTEDATQRKRQRAREQGTVTRSRDLAAAVVLISAVLFLRLGGEWMLERLLADTASGLQLAGELASYPGEDFVPLGIMWVARFVYTMLPMLLVLVVVALMVNFAQVGFVVSWEPLIPKLDRLDPIAGLQRLFSLRSVIMLLMSMGKVALVVAVSYYGMKDVVHKFNDLSYMEAGPAFALMASLMFDFMMKLAVLLLILALLDTWYQIYQGGEDMKMTRQEVKEEMRESDGDPHIKGRRRQIQRQMAQQRMMAAVPSAEVVVRNPDHYAVALSYEKEKDAAPVVVAKGMDKMALRIISIAVRNDVPCIVNPPLARMLHKRLDIGDRIPPDLFEAVAKVLAYVYEQNEARRATKRALAS